MSEQPHLIAVVADNGKIGQVLTFLQQLAIGSREVKPRDTEGVLMVAFLLPPYLFMEQSITFG